MIEKLLAGTALVICVGLLLRMALPALQRRRLDNRVRAIVRSLDRTLHRLVIGPYRAWRLRRSAQSMAEQVIRRARDGRGTWTGNVYRPKSFEKPPKDLEKPPSKEH